MKEVTKKDIRKHTGKCRYCEVKNVMWFCPECWFGVCDDCIEEEYMGKCMGDCFDKVTDLGDITIFK